MSITQGGSNKWIVTPTMLLGFSLAFPLIASVVTPAATQEPRRYVRLSVGPSQLQRAATAFPSRAALQPTLTLGYALSGSHSIGVAISYLKSETTEVVPPGVFPEAPYTLGVRAIPIELRYQYRLHGLGRVHPLVSLGGLWVAVRDTWMSDTPTESAGSSVYGITGSIGLLVAVGAQTGIVVRGSYRGVTGASTRPVRHIGLSGLGMDGGVELRF